MEMPFFQALPSDTVRTHFLPLFQFSLLDTLVASQPKTNKLNCQKVRVPSIPSPIRKSLMKQSYYGREIEMQGVFHNWLCNCYLLYSFTEQDLTGIMICCSINCTIHLFLFNTTLSHSSPCRLLLKMLSYFDYLCFQNFFFFFLCFYCFRKGV